MKWEDIYSVGVGEFDSQHKKLFKIINELLEEGNFKGEKREKIKKDIEQLVAYGDEHLAEEEKYFDKYNYPKKKWHKGLHDEYREKIKKLQEEFNNGDIEAYSKLIVFIGDWWVNHINKADKEYSEFFKEHNFS